MTKSDKNRGDKEGSFMLPIWLITFSTMAGTLLVSYAVHAYYINESHKENMKQVEMIEYRTSKYSEYKQILEEDGKAAAADYLNKE